MSSARESVLSTTGSLRFKRLQLGVVVLGALVILAFALSSAYDAWRSYRYALIATNREITNTANALAEQTAWTLQAVDLLLLDTARWYSSDSRQIAPERLNGILATRTVGVPQVRQVMIVDAQGNQLYTSLKKPLPLHNVSDRSYFIAQRNGTAAGMFMSEPLVTRSEGHAAVEFSRRLEDENGGFADVDGAIILREIRKLHRQNWMRSGKDFRRWRRPPHRRRWSWSTRWTGDGASLRLRP